MVPGVNCDTGLHFHAKWFLLWIRPVLLLRLSALIGSDSSAAGISLARLPSPALSSARL